MLAIIMIFFLSLLTASTVIWLYRMVSRWRGFNHALVGRTDSTVRTKMRVQQGFISLTSARRERVKNVKHRSLKGGVAPWGW